MIDECFEGKQEQPTVTELTGNPLIDIKIAREKIAQYIHDKWPDFHKASKEVETRLGIDKEEKEKEKENEKAKKG